MQAGSSSPSSSSRPTSPCSAFSSTSAQALPSTTSVHTLTLPLTLLLASYTTHHPLALEISLIWTAHIAADRLLGYGLKYPTFFKDTHLQHIPTHSNAVS